MNIKYFALRFVRHCLLESVARFLLKHRWTIHPGLESSDPHAAVEQYVKGLSAYGESIQGRRVQVFGYGGRFAAGVELLRRGASHVVLCDHFVLMDRERNLELLANYADYLIFEDDNVKPCSEFIILLHDNISDNMIQKQTSEVDHVLSTSVYEHLGDVENITRALAKLTAAHCAHLHFVDMRDYYFSLSFEMLTFSECIRKNLLNPTTNLKCLQLTGYQKIFNAYFQKADISVLNRQEGEFQAPFTNLS